VELSLWLYRQRVKRCSGSGGGDVLDVCRVLRSPNRLIGQKPSDRRGISIKVIGVGVDDEMVAVVEDSARTCRKGFCKCPLASDDGTFGVGGSGRSSPLCERLRHSE
jgi:hypothetical protein